MRKQYTIILLGLIFLTSLLLAVGGNDIDLKGLNKKYGADFYPPENKIMHLVGPTKEDSVNYIENVSNSGKGSGLPSGVSFYTNLDQVGIDSPWAKVKEDNHQDLNYILENFENTILQVGLYLHFLELESIGNGELDDKIIHLANRLKKITRPIYFVIGYEFDGPHNQYNPKEYKAAYRRIVDIFFKSGVANISYVWHSTGTKPTYRNLDLMKWYPGDRYVNWIGTSFFYPVEEGKHNVLNRNRLLKIARLKKVPIMICESSPIRNTPVKKKLKGRHYWDFWFRPFFEFIDQNPEVQAFNITNCDWSTTSVAKQYRLDWGDCQIQSDPEVLKQWRSRMKNSHYLHASTSLYKTLGFVND